MKSPDTPGRFSLPGLLFADFDRSVHRIAAQLFLLRVEIGGKLRRHVPAFLLDTDSGSVVVDVKPRARLQKVAFTFAWTEQVVTARGWRYKVWSEPDPVELENVRSSRATGADSCSIPLSLRCCGVRWRMG